MTLGQRLVPDLLSKIPNLLHPTAFLVILERIVIRYDLIVPIRTPRARLIVVARQVVTMPLARLLQGGAEIHDDPARDDLQHRHQRPPEHAVLFGGVRGARRARVDEARRGVDEGEVLLGVVRGQIIKGQAGADGRVVDDGDDPPFLVQVEVVFVDALLLRPIEDGEDPRPRRLVQER